MKIDMFSDFYPKSPITEKKKIFNKMLSVHRLYWERNWIIFTCVPQVISPDLFTKNVNTTDSMVCKCYGVLWRYLQNLWAIIDQGMRSSIPASSISKVIVLWNHNFSKKYLLRCFTLIRNVKQRMFCTLPLQKQVLLLFILLTSSIFVT